MNRRTFLKGVVTLALAVVFPIKTCEAQPTPPTQVSSFGFPLTFPFSFPEQQLQKVSAAKMVGFRSEKWLYRLLGIK